MRLLTLILALLLTGCGRAAIDGIQSQPLTANAILSQTSALALAVNPQARFYLLVGHQIAPDGTIDGAAGGYWVANYFIAAANPQQRTRLSYKVGPDDLPVLTRQDAAPMPSGYCFVTPQPPQFDSSSILQGVHSQGLFVGQDVPEVQLYSPLEAKYFGKLLYYVGDTPPNLAVLDANTGTNAG